jgi:hypothetical protein
MRARRAVLGAAGLIAVSAGTWQIARGLRGTAGTPDDLRQLGAEGWLRDLDSEVRFYAAWYGAAGVLMLRDAIRGATPRHQQALGVAWLAAAGARLLGRRQLGGPSGLFTGLTGAELLLGALLALPPDSVLRAEEPRARRFETSPLQETPTRASV